MPSEHQSDYPGAWHHVINRGVAKRTIFASHSDYRYFLSQLARAVRHKEFEVHAYCLMSTHFHLLLRSVGGELPAAMRRIETSYERRFNQQQKRYGALLLRHDTARQVRSEAYRRILIRYIHFNPVKASLAHHPKDYRYSSAWSLAQSRTPKWLANYWLDAEKRFVEELGRRVVRNQQQQQSIRLNPPTG